MTTKLTTFEEEKMREFREKFAHLTEQSANGFLYFKHTNLKVRDFEQEILSPLKQQREMIRKEIEKTDIADDKVGTFQDGYRCLRKQILYFLSNKETGDGSVRCCDNGDMDEEHKCLRFLSNKDI